MRYVTLLLSGVPQNVLLTNLRKSLDRLFDTNEIGTFELRDLPNQYGKRQIALDFRSGFDAIEAQIRLDGYHYELPNGCEYTLCAKITRKKEFLRPECPVQEGWSAMALVPYVSDGTMFRANAKLDAQLELLRKQKLILQTEREVLKEKKKLRQDYSSKSIIDSDEEASSPKRCRRSTSRDSSRSRERSSSRELRSYTKSSKGDYKLRRSKSRESKLLALKSSSMEPGSKLRKLRSRSRDRGLRSPKAPGSKPRKLRSRSKYRGLKSSKKLRSKSRKLRSRSKDSSLRSSKEPGSEPRELRSRSKDRGARSSKKLRSKSRKLRSRSKDSSLRSSKEPGSEPRELRSRSKDRGARSSKKLKSKSRKLRSRSKDSSLRSSKEPGSEPRELRSRSKDRGARSSKKLRSKSRKLRSRSKDSSLRSSKEPGSEPRELRSRSKDRGARSSKKLKSKSRKLRSRSKDSSLRSSKEPGSEPRELRSRSKDRGARSSKKLKSKSRKLRSRSKDSSLRSSKEPGSEPRELRSRSKDRGARSSKKHKSKSRKLRSRSKDPGLRSSKEPGSEPRELRSRSKDRGARSSKKLGAKSREPRSRSRHRDLRSSRKNRSISRELRSRSKEPGSKPRERRSRSRDRGLRSRDFSRDVSGTRDRDLYERSPSWDIDSIDRRSRSREIGSRNRRSRSRDHTSDYRKEASPWEWDIIGREQRSRSDRMLRSPDHSLVPRPRWDRRSRSRWDRRSRSRWDRRSRSQERRFRPLAIMPRSPVHFRPLPNERIICVRPVVDYASSADDDLILYRKETDDIEKENKDYDDNSCYYYKRSFNDETPDIEKATSSLEIRKNCTITSDSTANKEKELTDTTKQITVFIGPKKTAESDKNKTTESDTNEIGSRSNKTNLPTNETVSGSVNEMKNKCVNAKENTKVVNKAETERNRIATLDVMFLMETLVDEMSIKENITVSETRRNMLDDKLKPLVQDRIKPLAANENATNLEVLLRYRELYRKQEDILLIKKLLREIPEDKTSCEVAGQVAEITNSKENDKMMDVTPNTVKYVTVHSKRDLTAAGGYAVLIPHYMKNDEPDFTADVVEIIDPEYGYPKENQIPDTVINLTLDNNKGQQDKKKVQVPKRPQFVLVVKRLLKQMKPSISKVEKKEPFPLMQFKNVLRSILKDTVKGKGYMTTNEIVHHFRNRHPRAKDDEFVFRSMEEIKTGKYGAYIIDVEDDEDDVLLIEKEYDVVTVLDSDDEQDELLEEEEPVKSEIQLTQREEAGATLQSQDKTSTPVEPPQAVSEVPQVEIKKSESKEVAFEKEATANTETASKSELPSVPYLIEHYGVINKETISNDVSNTNEIVVESINNEITTEPSDVAVENLLNSFKDFDGLDKETISNDVSNTDETLVESVNSEIKTELTDVAVENLLDSLKDFDGLDNTGEEATETETPQVTSITIMTSFSELFSLKYDDNKNICKQVDEIKKENDVDVENYNDYYNNEDSLINESNVETEGSLLENINEPLVNDHSEITVPVVEEKENTGTTTIKNGTQDEEESIESIIKYVESFCNDLSQ